MKELAIDCHIYVRLPDDTDVKDPVDYAHKIFELLLGKDGDYQIHGAEIREEK